MAGVVTSPEQICNMALGHIRKPGNITSLSDRTTKAARVCSRFYANTRDAMLQGYQWNFSIHSRSLPADATVPVTASYNLALVLPGDCLRVLEVEGLDNNDWEVEEGGRLLLSGTAPLVVKYIRRKENPAEYPALFVEMLSLQLAQFIAPELTQQEDIADRLEGRFQKAETKAKRFDAFEKAEKPRPVVSRYISGRGRSQ